MSRKPEHALPSVGRGGSWLSGASPSGCCSLFQPRYSAMQNDSRGRGTRDRSGRRHARPGTAKARKILLRNRANQRQAGAMEDNSPPATVEPSQGEQQTESPSLSSEKEEPEVVIEMDAPGNSASIEEDKREDNTAVLEGVDVYGQRQDTTVPGSSFEVEVGSLQIIPRKNAAEHLMLAPGVLTANHGGEGHAHETFMRGFAAKERAGHRVHLGRRSLERGQQPPRPRLRGLAVPSAGTGAERVDQGRPLRSRTRRLRLRRFRRLSSGCPRTRVFCEIRLRSLEHSTDAVLGWPPRN